MGFIWSFIFQNVYSLMLFGEDSPIHIPFLCDMLQDPNKAVFCHGNHGNLADSRISDADLSEYVNNIPEDLYEAASIDGATAWQKFRHITVPMLMPAFTIVFFLTLSSSFKMLDENLALTGGDFGTRMLSLQILLTTRENTPPNYGMAQAQAVIFFILIAVVSIVQVIVTKRERRLRHNDCKQKNKTGRNVCNSDSSEYLYVIPNLLFDRELIQESERNCRISISVPSSFDFSYLKNAAAQIRLGESVVNTLIITVVAVALIVVISSLTAWMMVRNKTKASSFLFLCFTAAMLIPFQSVMYPLVNLMEALGLKNTFGLILMYGGFGLSMTVFFVSRIFKSVPLSLEEAAVIDGANIFQLFFNVVFPLVKPITATVVITNAMWIWNDYLLPFLIIGNNDSKTLTLSLYYAKSLSGQYEIHGNSSSRQY